MSSIFEGVAPANFGGFTGTIGTDFTAQHTGTVDAIQWFQPPASGPASVTVGLFDTATQALLSSASSVGALTANAWNSIALPAPLAITPGRVYTAGVHESGANIGFTNGRLLTFQLPNGYLFNAAGDLTGFVGRVTGGGVIAFPATFDTSGTAFGADVVFTQTPTCPECPECPPTEGFLINLTSPGFIHVVTGVGSCVIDALDQTPAGAPCRQCLLLPTQQIPWDNCGPCDVDCSGQVAVAIREVYGSERFPSPLNGASWRKCNHRYEIVRAVVSVTRCVPTMGQDGAPPPCADELAAAVTLENDRTAVRQAIACCLGEANRLTPYWVSEWVLGGSTTVGELGGCAGVETEFLVGVQSCLCPD